MSAERDNASLARSGARQTRRGAPLGYHAVAIVGYSPQYIYFATWGTVQRATWAWWQARAFAAFALLPKLFVNAGHGPVPSIPTGDIENSWFSSTASSASNVLTGLR